MRLVQFTSTWSGDNTVYVNPEHVVSVHRVGNSTMIQVAAQNQNGNAGFAVSENMDVVVQRLTSPVG